MTLWLNHKGLTRMRKYAYYVIVGLIGFAIGRFSVRDFSENSIEVKLYEHGSEKQYQVLDSFGKVGINWYNDSLLTSISFESNLPSRKFKGVAMIDKNYGVSRVFLGDSGGVVFYCGYEKPREDRNEIDTSQLSAEEMNVLKKLKGEMKE